MGFSSFVLALISLLPGTMSNDVEAWKVLGASTLYLSFDPERRRTVRHIICALVVALFMLGYLVGEAADPGDVIINEVMQNPDAVNDADGEWFELYNVSDLNIDIDGWVIADDGGQRHTIDNGSPLVVPTGGYLVLGNNDDMNTNGGYECDYVYSGWGYLGNGDDEIILEQDGVEMARLNYDGGPVWPDPTGHSMAWTGPPGDYQDGSDWVEETVVQYGDGDYGTPGGPNSAATGVEQSTWGQIKADYR